MALSAKEAREIKFKKSETPEEKFEREVNEILNQKEIDEAVEDLERGIDSIIKEEIDEKSKLSINVWNEDTLTISVKTHYKKVMIFNDNKASIFITSFFDKILKKLNQNYHDKCWDSNISIKIISNSWGDTNDGGRTFFKIKLSGFIKEII